LQESNFPYFFPALRISEFQFFNNIQSVNRPARLGPKRTSRFVIILSLAVFDRVKAEGLAASVKPDARNAPDLAARPRLRVTRSEIAIHEFGRHRHHDQSKNPAHHTTGSKLAPRRAVLKFNLDAVHRSTMQMIAHRRTISGDVRFLL
jgi:hypothetical protein